MKDEDITLRIVLDHLQAVKYELQQDIRSVEERLTKQMDRKIDTLDNKLSAKIDVLDDKVDWLIFAKENFDNRFEKLDKEKLPLRVRRLEKSVGISLSGR
ncbi:MAG: hypothetical protein O2904_05030 [bacterium]|nr:hypothetical protein [bacterium]